MGSTVSCVTRNEVEQQTDEYDAAYAQYFAVLEQGLTGELPVADDDEAVSEEAVSESVLERKLESAFLVLKLDLEFAELQTRDLEALERALRAMARMQAQMVPADVHDMEMMQLTPPGTPPGEPPEHLDDSPADSYVRGELVFAENLNTTNQPGLATFTQLLPWQRAPRDAGVGLPQASGGPARDMRRNLEDADKGQMLYPALQVGPWASADAPMNMPVMSSSNQLHEVKMTQEESQNDLSASDVDDLQLLPERPSSDLPAAVPWSSRDSTGVVSMMAGPPAQSFGGNLFSSMEPSLQESASDTAKDAGAVEI